MQGLYYANNMTEEFSSDCPSLITVDIVSRSNIIMISGSSSINITQSGPLSLYIGGLPSKDCKQLCTHPVTLKDMVYKPNAVLQNAWRHLVVLEHRK